MIIDGIGIIQFGVRRLLIAAGGRCGSWAAEDGVSGGCGESRHGGSFTLRLGETVDRSRGWGSTRSRDWRGGDAGGDGVDLVVVHIVPEWNAEGNGREEGEEEDLGMHGVFVSDEEFFFLVCLVIGSNLAVLFERKLLGFLEERVK